MNEIPELVERFRAGGELVRQALEGVSGPEADFRPGPDAWGVRQLAAHLADSEVVAGWRFRRLIADNPTLEAFDEKLWAANLAYDRRDHTGNLASFLRLRKKTTSPTTRSARAPESWAKPETPTAQWPTPWPSSRLGR